MLPLTCGYIWRRRPESNRCTGLCRPLPKPLGHAAKRSAGGAYSPCQAATTGRLHQHGPVVGQREERGRRPQHCRPARRRLFAVADSRRVDRRCSHRSSARLEAGLLASPVFSPDRRQLAAIVSTDSRHLGAATPGPRLPVGEHGYDDMGVPGGGNLGLEGHAEGNARSDPAGRVAVAASAAHVQLAVAAGRLHVIAQQSIDPHWFRPCCAPGAGKDGRGPPPTSR